VPLDVELHHGAKALGGDVLGGGEELAAGVVDKQVDPAVALQRFVDQALHLAGESARCDRETCPESATNISDS